MWNIKLLTLLSQSVHLLSRVWLLATPWTAACQASLSITNSRSLLTLMSIESVMPSNCLIPFHAFSSCLQSFPASGSFLMSPLFASDGQSIGASASVLPMNIQDWFPLGLTGWISWQSKGLSRVFSSTTVKRVRGRVCKSLGIASFSMPTFVWEYDMSRLRTIASTPDGTAAEDVLCWLV